MNKFGGWRCRSLPIVEMWEGWNSLSVNRHNKHVFPTPESPSSRSRKSTSYCLAMLLFCWSQWWIFLGSAIIINFMNQISTKANWAVSGQIPSRLLPMSAEEPHEAAAELGLLPRCWCCGAGQHNKTDALPVGAAESAGEATGGRCASAEDFQHKTGKCFIVFKIGLKIHN